MRSLRRRSTPAAVVAALFIVLAGCELFKAAVQNFSDMSPKEKATWLMAAYDREYSAYLALAAHPGVLTEAQKEVLRAKKKAMIVAWPLVRAYSDMVQNGVVTAAVEAAALHAVEALLGIGEAMTMPVVPGDPTAPDAPAEGGVTHGR